MNAMTEMYVKFQTYLAALKKDEKGQGLVEYALILVLIAIVCIAVMKLVGGETCNALSTAASALKPPTSAATP